MSDDLKTLKDYLNSVGNVSDAISDLGKQAGFTESHIEDLKKEFKDNLQALIPYIKGLVDGKKALAIYNTEIDETIKFQKLHSKALKDGTGNLAELKQEMDAHHGAAVKAIQDAREQERARKKLTDAVKIEAMGWREYAEATKVVGSGVTKTIGNVVKLGTIFGGQALTLNNAKNAILQYNDSMFKLSRMQQTSNQTMGDLSESFKNVRKHTILAKQDFLDFANTMSSGFLGVKPSLMEISNLTVSMQKQFGPNIETMKQKMQGLLGIQNKFPSLYGEIIKAQKIMASGDEYTATLMRNSIQARMSALGYAKEEQDTMLQFLNKVTPEQERQVKLNKKVADAEKAHKDALLAAGKSMEDVFIKVAKLVEKLNKGLEKIPGIVGDAMIAMTAFGIASSALAIGGPMLGGLKGLKGGIPKIPGAARGLKSKIGGFFGTAAEEAVEEPVKRGLLGPKIALRPLAEVGSEAAKASKITGVGVFDALKKWGKSEGVMNARAGLNAKEGLMSGGKFKRGLAGGAVGAGADYLAGKVMGDEYSETNAGALTKAAAGGLGAFATGGIAGLATYGVGKTIQLKMEEAAANKESDQIQGELHKRRTGKTALIRESGQSMVQTLRERTKRSGTGEDLEKKLSLLKKTVNEQNIGKTLEEKAIILNKRLNDLLEQTPDLVQNSFKKVESINKDWESQKQILNSINDSLQGQIENYKILNFIPKGLMEAATQNLDETFKKLEIRIGSVGKEYDTVINNLGTQNTGIKTEKDIFSHGDSAIEKTQNAIPILAKLYDDLGKKIKEYSDGDSLDNKSKLIELNSQKDSIEAIIKSTSEMNKESSALTISRLNQAKQVASIDQELKINMASSYKALASSTKSYLESLGAGMAPSIIATQDIIDKNDRIIEQNKITISNIQEQIELRAKKAGVEGMLPEFMSPNADTVKVAEDMLKLAKERGANTTEQDDLKEILSLRKQQLDTMVKEIDLKKESAELTKSMREGYLEAQRARQIGKGGYMKILPNKDRAKNKILEWAQQSRPGEQNYANTMAEGGNVSMRMNPAAFRAMGKPMAEYDVDTGIKTEGAGASRARMDVIYGYGKTKKPTAGTPAVSENTLEAFRDRQAASENSVPWKRDKSNATNPTIKSTDAVITILNGMVNLKKTAENLRPEFSDQTQNKAKGGSIRYYADGDNVSGMKPKGTDTIPAMLTPGEFVINKKMVDKYGKDTMEKINNGTLYAADGGLAKAQKRYAKLQKRAETVFGSLGADFTDNRTILIAGLKDDVEKAKLEVERLTKEEEFHNIANPALISRGEQRQGEKLFNYVENKKLTEASNIKNWKDKTKSEMNSAKIKFDLENKEKLEQDQRRYELTYQKDSSGNATPVSMPDYSQKAPIGTPAGGGMGPSNIRPTKFLEDTSSWKVSGKDKKTTRRRGYIGDERGAFTGTTVAKGTINGKLASEFSFGSLNSEKNMSMPSPIVSPTQVPTTETSTNPLYKGMFGHIRSSTKVPTAHMGAYVATGGLAELRANEVVAPKENFDSASGGSGSVKVEISFKGAAEEYLSAAKELAQGVAST